MPYGFELSAKCPYFLTYNKNKRAHNITITCEPLNNNLGFDMTLKSCFDTARERSDYMELFCCDRYTECPMFKAISEKYKSNLSKNDRGGKGEEKWQKIRSRNRPWEGYPSKTS